MGVGDRRQNRSWRNWRNWRSRQNWRNRRNWCNWRALHQSFQQDLHIRALCFLCNSFVALVRVFWSFVV